MDPRSDGAGGRLAHYLYLRNDGTATCRLAGYPRTVTVTEPGHPPVAASNGSFFPVPRAKPLNPGRTAVLVLETAASCDDASAAGSQPAHAAYHLITVGLRDGEIRVRTKAGLRVTCGVSTSKFGSQ